MKSVGYFFFLYILTQFNLPAWSQVVKDVCRSQERSLCLPTSFSLSSSLLLALLWWFRRLSGFFGGVFFLVPLPSYPDTRVRQWCLIPTTPTSPTLHSPRQPPADPNQAQGLLYCLARQRGHTHTRGVRGRWQSGLASLPTPNHNTAPVLSCIWHLLCKVFGISIVSLTLSVF